jgi:hypothetical protein
MPLRYSDCSLKRPNVTSAKVVLRIDTDGPMVLPMPGLMSQSVLEQVNIRSRSYDVAHHISAIKMKWSRVKSTDQLDQRDLDCDICPPREILPPIPMLSPLDHRTL